MNSAWIKGIIVGGVVATAGGAIAGYNMTGGAPLSPPTHAEVLSVVPATQVVSEPREVCKDVTVTRQAEPRDKHKLAGTAAGALVGGIVGNQVGGGSGKKLATVAGVAAGAYAGNRIQDRAQADDVYTTTEQRCSTVADSVEKVIGYDVTYRIGEEQGRIRTRTDPGERIPLVNGELALN